MKHTSVANARLLLSISVVIILGLSVIPQSGLISSFVEAHHRGYELAQQREASRFSESPTESESDNIGSASTPSDTDSGSTSMSGESGYSAAHIQPESNEVGSASTPGDSDTGSTSMSGESGYTGASTDALTQSESDNIGSISTTSDSTTGDTSNTVSPTSSTSSDSSSSTSNSSSDSGSEATEATELPIITDTATPTFLENDITSTVSTVPLDPSPSELGGSNSSNDTSIEPVESGSGVGPASGGTAPSASNSSSADGQPADSVSSADQSLQVSNETSSSVGTVGGSANKSSSEGSPLTSIGSSNIPASRPAADNSTMALTSHPSDLGVVASESISASSSSNPNAVAQTISTGDGVQVINYGNVNNVENVSATISLDKPSYNPGDSPVISINDPEANVDPDQVNTIVVIITSTSDKSGIPLTLTETGANTGVFQSAFSFTTGNSSATSGSIKVAAGDNVGISYDGSHPRMQAEIGGVKEGGNVELIQVPDPADKPSILIGGAVQLTFGDEVVLAPNAKTAEINQQCEDFGIPPPDCPSGVAAGETNITLSYANAPLNGQDPTAFTIWQNVPGTGWVDLKNYQLPGSAVQVNITTQTVTAYTPFKGGTFVIGVPTSGGGGGGGGLGLPGAGIVLDLLAPVTAESQPPSTTPPPTTSPPPSSTSSPPPASTLASDNATVGIIGGQATGAGQKNNDTELGTSAASASQIISSGSTSESGAFDTTIPVPGIGNVTLSFSNIGSDRSFVVTEVKSPSELSALKISKAANGVGKVLFTLDNVRYDVVGPVFNIGPTDAKVNGTVTVTIPYNSTLAPQGGDSVRMLQFSGNTWNDVTTNPPADGHVVTGSLNGLGPVVAAIKSK